MGGPSAGDQRAIRMGGTERARAAPISHMGIYHILADDRRTQVYHKHTEQIFHGHLGHLPHALDVSRPSQECAYEGDQHGGV